MCHFLIYLIVFAMFLPALTEPDIYSNFLSFLHRRLLLREQHEAERKEHYSHISAGLNPTAPLLRQRRCSVLVPHCMTRMSLSHLSQQLQDISNRPNSGRTAQPHIHSWTSAL